MGPTIPYSGHADPHGVTAVRRVAGVAIRKASVSDQDNNAYLITDAASGAQLLVDAADGAERLLALVAEGAADGGRGLATVVTTHRHWDHHRALADVSARTGATTLAGVDDADALPVATDRRLHHGERVRVGALDLEVIALRGHTPGSVALLLQDADGGHHLFTGDSLFPGGPGRTTSPADFTSLMDDLQARVFDPLPDGTWVYPGHGDDTTLGTERPQLAEWRARGW